MFGCKAYMQAHAHQRKKLDSKSTVGTMVGYSLFFKAYRILHRDDAGRITVSESRHVTFDERSTGPFADPLSYGNVFPDVPGSMGELPPADQVCVTPGHHPAVAAPNAPIAPIAAPIAAAPIPVPVVPMVVPIPGDDGDENSADGTSGSQASGPAPDAPDVPNVVMKMPRISEVREQTPKIHTWRLKE